MTDHAKPDLRVVEAFPSTTLQDVAACIRAVADAVERGDHGNIVSGAGVVLDDDGTPVIFGWGRTDRVHTIGILQIGASILANMADAQR